MNHVTGGRSRLHLIDFGGCERTKTSGGGITLNALGNVILGIFYSQRHLPCKESKVTQVLKECLSSLSCQATMLAHVSPEPSHYSETLHTIQLASRIHRMRRKKLKTGSAGTGSGSGSGGSSDETKTRLVKLDSFGQPATSDGSSNFTSTDPSSSNHFAAGHSGSDFYCLKTASDPITLLIKVVANQKYDPIRLRPPAMSILCSCLLSRFIYNLNKIYHV